MTIFRSIPTALCLASAVLLTAWGAGKKGSVTSFLGALCGTASVLSALMDGANLSEPLVYILLLLFISLPRSTRSTAHADALSDAPVHMAAPAKEEDHA